MACGTGKTFTALKIAEDTAHAEKRGPATVLFLVPVDLAAVPDLAGVDGAVPARPMRSFAVCSDTKVGKKSTAGEDINAHDLALPATTDPAKLIAQVKRPRTLPRR